MNPTILSLTITPPYFEVSKSQSWFAISSLFRSHSFASRINYDTYRVGIQLLLLLLKVGLNHGGFRCDIAAVFRHRFVLSRFNAATAEAQQAIHDHAHNSLDFVHMHHPHALRLWPKSYCPCFAQMAWYRIFIRITFRRFHGAWFRTGSFCSFWISFMEFVRSDRIPGDLHVAGNRNILDTLESMKGHVSRSSLELSDIHAFY